MVEPIVIAHLVRETGGRGCSAPDAPMTIDFTAKVWATHARWDNSSSVIRCALCAELIGHESSLRSSAPTQEARSAVAAASMI